ncbi:13779_t:CDS:10 [Entrophospora sp. SA101]|nr:13779_t:CDS:10 [Entrophospora sp. SA101]
MLARIYHHRSDIQHSYNELLLDVIGLKTKLLPLSKNFHDKDNLKNDLNEERVAFLCPNGYDYVISLWSIWAAGGIAVPLCTTHPSSELSYVLKDSHSSIVLTHPEFEDRIRPIAKNANIENIMIVDHKTIGYNDNRYGKDDDFKNLKLTQMDESRRALIIYTSGTTGKPKGVVSTHLNIKAQVESLVEAWRLSRNDKILHVLPLHHLHGIMNALMCQLYVGATVEMLPKFDAETVWNRWMDPKRDLTLFMAQMPKNLQPEATKSCSQFRLMVSGSSSLPIPIRNRWKEISGGQILLERYGMSEIGMALSHEYDPNKRYKGCVGLPLPGVNVRLLSDDNKDITNELNLPGELQVKGETVFKEYWNKPEATIKEFTSDGWFKTGDIAMRTTKGFEILGRKSVDIIKSGGYKISALEIEKELSEHPNILEVYIVGVEDEEWGQKIGALVTLKDNKQNLNLDELREFAGQFSGSVEENFYFNSDRKVTKLKKQSWKFENVDEILKLISSLIIQASEAYSDNVNSSTLPSTPPSH